MTLPEVADFIKSVGFPIAVALFVLLRIEPRIRELTAALVDLRVVLARHAGKEG
jgi:hypothetical protein